jgi:hypothetical protein
MNRGPVDPAIVPYSAVQHSPPAQAYVISFKAAKLVTQLTTSSEVNPAAQGRQVDKKQRMFGIHCVRCDYEIIAPLRTELLDDKLIRHIWDCQHRKGRFESFPRFPKDARLVKEVMTKVDVFSTYQRGFSLEHPPRIKPSRQHRSQSSLPLDHR